MCYEYVHKVRSIRSKQFTYAVYAALNGKDIIEFKGTNTFKIR